jgi:peptidyl-prolyl cis-trans isomerase C
MLRSQLPEQYQQLADDVVFNGLIDQLVNQLLGDTLEVEPKRIGIAITNEVRSLRASRDGQTFTGMIDETDLQAAYDARFADVAPDAEFNAPYLCGFEAKTKRSRSDDDRRWC